MPSERHFSSEGGGEAQLGELGRGDLHIRNNANRLIPCEAEVTGIRFAHRLHLFVLSESMALLDAACITTLPWATTTPARHRRLG